MNAIRTALIVALALPAAIAVQSLPAAAGDWKKCTHEGGFCSPNEQFTMIRYGTTPHDARYYAEKVQSSGAECSNHAFGKDPVPGQYKNCWVYVPNWEYCTNEGGFCKSGGARHVRYGTDPHAAGKHLTRPVAGTSGITCANHDFGGDPVPGRRKSCWVYK